MHDSSGMHVFQSTTNLDEIFPDGLLWNQSVLTLEMLQKSYNTSQYWAECSILELYACTAIGGVQLLKLYRSTIRFKMLFLLTLDFY